MFTINKRISFTIFLVPVFTPVITGSFVLSSGKSLPITKFSSDSDMDNHFCAADISYSGNDVPSLGTCIQLCNHYGSSLIYNELEGHCQCHGTSNRSLLACAFENNSGYRFFMKADVTFITLESPVPGFLTMVGPALSFTLPSIALATVPTTSYQSASSSSAPPVIATVTTTLSPDEWRFRLVNGTSTSGRLEVYRNGTWGVVYGFSVSAADATIICRDILKISRFGFPIYGDYFGVAALKNGLSKTYATEYDILCHSNATCNDYMWKNEGDADFPEFAEFGTVGLDCTDDELKVQLADGKNASSGRLEVMLLGTWGTVCGDDDWQDGPLFCGYLGLEYKTFEMAGNETTSGPVWIHGSLYNCDWNNATSPADCEWSPYTKTHFNTSCTHNSDVILHCESIATTPPFLLSIG